MIFKKWPELFILLQLLTKGIQNELNENKYLCKDTFSHTCCSHINARTPSTLLHPISDLSDDRSC